MATTKQQVLDACNERRDDPATLVCFWRPADQRYEDASAKPTRCSFNDLPETEFDEGYGGVEGEEVICFSPAYVYIKGCYDGSEWVQAVPRNPDSVTFIPIVGGG